MVVHHSAAFTAAHGSVAVGCSEVGWGCVRGGGLRVGRPAAGRGTTADGGPTSNRGGQLKELRVIVFSQSHLCPFQGVHKGHFSTLEVSNGPDLSLS